MEDKIFLIGFWIAVPTLMITYNCKHKWVRILGFIMCFPLLPLLPLGYPILLLGILVKTLKEI